MAGNLVCFRRVFARQFSLFLSHLPKPIVLAPNFPPWLKNELFSSALFHFPFVGESVILLLMRVLLWAWGRVVGVGRAWRQDFFSYSNCGSQGLDVKERRYFLVLSLKLHRIAKERGYRLKQKCYLYQ